MNLIKKNKKLFLGILIGTLLSSITVYAANKYLASDIEYKNTTVEKALNDLYETKKSTCDKSLVGTEWKFNYTGSEEFFVAPCNGVYKLEAWGAQGGNLDNNYSGGYGGYSYGNIIFNNGTKIYINVGGTGKATSSAANQKAQGGYNGGGNAYNKPSASGVVVSGGGGATHMATYTGLLKSLEQKKDTIIMVAAGGAGVMNCPGINTCYAQFHTNDIGHAGGYIGTLSTGYIQGNITNKSSGGEQNGIGELGTNKGSFGQGASVDYASDGTPGGGGGLYGGNSGIFSAGGGSSYIGNSKLTNKAMYCYNCTESNDENTKTISVKDVSETPTSNYAKKGNGYAKITLISLK